MLTIQQMRLAQQTLKDVARKTGLISAADISRENSVFLKEENLQVTGSFKIRGAFNKISSLSAEEKKKGIIACSAGNHAQGVALAAAQKHIKATIYIPSCAPISKIEKTKNYGAEVRIVNGVYDDAYEKACLAQKKSGAVFLHPFNDEDVITGQGTVGLEILEQLPDVDAVVVPVGGGGLLSGVAFAVKTLKPNCKVYGVQAAGAPGMLRAFRDKKVEPLRRVSTFADGIAVKCPGDLTFRYCSKYVDDIVTVTDDEIAAAILHLLERQKIISEGAGAASVAAVMFDKLSISGQKVVCIISGGNIDVTILSRVIQRGLMEDGRVGRIQIDVADRPGQIMKVSSIIGNLGGNIFSIYHNRDIEAKGIDSCVLSIHVEARNRSHYEQICGAIAAAGYHILSK